MDLIRTPIVGGVEVTTISFVVNNKYEEQVNLCQMKERDTFCATWL